MPTLHRHQCSRNPRRPELDDELEAERLGDPAEGVEARGHPAGFEAGHRGLGRADPICELGLGEPETFSFGADALPHSNAVFAAS